MARFRIAYIAALAILVIAFIGSNNAWVLAGIVLALLMLVAGIGALFFITPRTKISFSVRPSCVVGQPLSLNVDVVRPRVAPVGRIDARVRCHNVMRDETFTIPVVLSAGHSGAVTFQLPLQTQSCGRVELSVDHVNMYDPFALFKFSKTVDFESSYAVYPEILDLLVSMERSPRASDTGVTYDPQRRGQDKSEPFEIRDYQQSDPLRSIHWKLSTKFDRLMVREASHPSNYDILVLADMGNTLSSSGEHVSDETLTAVLDLTISISYDLRRHGIGHNVAFVNGSRISDTMVDSPSNFDVMTEMLVSTPIPKTMGVNVDMFELYRRDHAFTKVVVVTADMNQGVFSELSRNVDVSVVCAVDEGTTTITGTDAFTLVGISVADLKQRVRNVVI